MPTEKRGRGADVPAEIPARGWKDVLWRVKDEIADDNVGLLSAGIAFYGLLALFPGIVAFMTISGALVDPQTVTEQMASLATVMPDEVTEIVMKQARGVVESSQSGASTLAGIGAIALALFSASRGVETLVQGISIAYDEKEERGFFKRKLIVFALTIGFIIGGLLVVLLLLAVPAALGYLALDDWTETMLIWIRWPLVLSIAACGIAILFRFGPDRADARWRWTTPGAALACALWIVGTAAFAAYVRNFASYNETFGTIAGIVVLLMWLWLTAYAILVGAEFDAEMEAQSRQDTTTGEPEPMGERGATKADELGEARA